jgi:hypothetical protein
VVRLFGLLHKRGGRPVSLKIRVRAADMPDGANVIVTDVQCQAGDMITAWTLAPPDLGVQPVEGWQWRNGVVAGSQTVVVPADAPSASPCVVDAREASGEVTAGAYRFGRVEGSARVDGWAHEATQGAGLPPYLTARSDVDVPMSVEGRALVTVAFRGLAVNDGALEPPAAPPEPDGTVTGVHGSWGKVLAAHPTWTAVNDAHEEWG